jgi:hypothetical protein
MAMPKAAMNEYNGPEVRNNDVGPSRQIFLVRRKLDPEFF